MVADTATYSFADLLSNIVDNRGKTCPVAEDGLPLIATNCVKNETLFPVFEKVRYVDQKTYESWFRGHPEPGDMIFVTKGSPGNVCWTPDPVNFCIAQDMVAIRANQEIVDPRYLFALLRTPATQSRILNMHVGTLIPHFKKGDFKNLFFEIPTDKGLQRAIGEIYLSFCEKIELNRQMNATLEAMAQALFKSWFIDFDPVIDNALATGNPIPEPLQVRAEARKALGDQRKPPLTQMSREAGSRELPEAIQKQFPSSFVFNEEMGWIPEGWEVQPLDAIVNLIGGGTPKTSVDEYWGGEIPWFSVVDAPNPSDVFVLNTEKTITQEGLENSSAKVLPKGTTIISARGTVGKCAVVARPMAMNQSCYAIRGKDNLPDYYTYYTILLRVSDLQQRGHGSVFNTITRDTFRSIKTCVGSPELLRLFDQTVSPYMDRIVNNIEQISSLSQSRDALLPKLLSGQVRIPDIEKLEAA